MKRVTKIVFDQEEKNAICNIGEKAYDLATKLCEQVRCTGIACTDCPLYKSMSQLHSVAENLNALGTNAD